MTISSISMTVVSGSGFSTGGSSSIALTVSSALRWISASWTIGAGSS
jgi:hypothetical protein